MQRPAAHLTLVPRTRARGIRRGRQRRDLGRAGRAGHAAPRPQLRGVPSLPGGGREGRGSGALHRGEPRLPRARGPHAAGSEAARLAELDAAAPLRMVVVGDPRRDDPAREEADDAPRPARARRGDVAHRSRRGGEVVRARRSEAGSASATRAARTRPCSRSRIRAASSRASSSPSTSSARIRPPRSRASRAPGARRAACASPRSCSATAGSCDAALPLYEEAVRGAIGSVAVRSDLRPPRAARRTAGPRHPAARATRAPVRQAARPAPPPRQPLRRLPALRAAFAAPTTWSGRGSSSGCPPPKRRRARASDDAGGRLRALLLLSCALAVGGRASADVATLDAFVAPRAGGRVRAASRSSSIGSRARSRATRTESPLLPAGRRAAHRGARQRRDADSADRALGGGRASLALRAARARAAGGALRVARARRAAMPGRSPRTPGRPGTPHLDRADAALAEAAKRAPELSRRHRRSACGWRCCVSRPREEIRAHFDAALRIEPDDELAHRNLLTALTRRWGGTDDAALGFARYTAQQHREDARLGLLVRYAHSEVAARLSDADLKLYYRQPAVWEEVSHALSRLIEAYPDSVWGHNSLAFVAGLTAHKDVALREFRWLAGRWDPTVWNDHAEFLRVPQLGADHGRARRRREVLPARRADVTPVEPALRVTSGAATGPARPPGAASGPSRALERTRGAPGRARFGPAYRRDASRTSAPRSGSSRSCSSNSRPLAARS